jgi:hypothetical protein
MRESKSRWVENLSTNNVAILVVHDFGCDGLTVFG